MHVNLTCYHIEGNESVLIKTYTLYSLINGTLVLSVGVQGHTVEAPNNAPLLTLPFFQEGHKL